MTTEASPTTECQWGKVRVLCVDDNRDSADSAAALMTECGCEARACYDGFTAIEIAKEFRPALCFIDLSMPGMDGDELAKILALEMDDPPVMVAVTALGGEDARRRVSMAGFEAHIVKPADPDQLIDIAHDVADRSGKTG